MGCTIFPLINTKTKQSPTKTLAPYPQSMCLSSFAFLKLIGSHILVEEGLVFGTMLGAILLAVLIKLAFKF